MCLLITVYTVHVAGNKEETEALFFYCGYLKFISRQMFVSAVELPVPWRSLHMNLSMYEESMDLCTPFIALT